MSTKKSDTGTATPRATEWPKEFRVDQLWTEALQWRGRARQVEGTELGDKCNAGLSDDRGAE